MRARRPLVENKFLISACSVSHQPFSFVGRGMTSDLDDGVHLDAPGPGGRHERPMGGEVLIRWSGPEEGPSADDEPEPEGWDHMVERMLVESACQGDDESLEALCRREWFVIFRLVSGSVPDTAEAEELTQEVFARAIASLPRFRYVGVPFRSTEARLPGNLLRDRWRQAQARPDVDGPVLDGPRSSPSRRPSCWLRPSGTCWSRPCAGCPTAAGRCCSCASSRAARRPRSASNGVAPPSPCARSSTGRSRPCEPNTAGQRRRRPGGLPGARLLGGGSLQPIPGPRPGACSTRPKCPELAPRRPSRPRPA